MRCGCPECGAYMANSDGVALGCVCPQCGFRCRMCLGTDTVISKEEIQRLKGTDWFQISDHEEDGDEKA